MNSIPKMTSSYLTQWRAMKWPTVPVLGVGCRRMSYINVYKIMYIYERKKTLLQHWGTIIHMLW